MPFDEIVTSLVRMAQDSLVSRHLAISVTGGLGEVPADVATPLAVVLAELVQNAIEHAFVDGDAEEDDGHDGAASRRVEPGSAGSIRVDLHNDGAQLRLEVIDDGLGLPDDFDFDETQSLGLSIVRDLIRSQLGGSITMSNRSVGEPGVKGTSWPSPCRFVIRSRSGSR